MQTNTRLPAKMNLPNMHSQMNKMPPKMFHSESMMLLSVLVLKDPLKLLNIKEALQMAEVGKSLGLSAPNK